MKIISAADLAKLIGADFDGNGDFLIEGMNSLSDACDKDVSFIVSEKYLEQLSSTKAQVIIVPIEIKDKLPPGKTYIYCDNPNVAFSKIVGMFTTPHSEYKPGIHSSAIIGKGVKIPGSCYIGANVIIENEVILGEDSSILAGVFIGENSEIGSNCRIYPNCVIREKTQIGNNVIIHPGVIVGSDGFGYEITSDGIVKIPQIGIVKIEDNVEIGANSTIDRARFGTTLIKKGVKIDNLVHVAHNVEVGENSMLIAQSGIAGSSKIGKNVIIAGQAGVSHGIKIGDGALISGQAGITKDIPPKTRWAGTPAIELRDWMAIFLCPKQIKKQKEKIGELEKILQSVQEELKGLKKKSGV